MRIFKKYCFYERHNEQLVPPAELELWSTPKTLYFLSHMEGGGGGRRVGEGDSVKPRNTVMST